MKKLKLILKVGVMSRLRLESYLNLVKIWLVNILLFLVEILNKKFDFLLVIVMDLYFFKFKYRLIVIFNMLIF